MDTNARKFNVVLRHQPMHDKDARPWRASVFTSDGKDYHSVAASPQQALIDMALFWSAREGSSVHLGQPAATE